MKLVTCERVIRKIYFSNKFFGYCMSQETAKRVSCQKEAEWISQLAHNFTFSAIYSFSTLTNNTMKRLHASAPTHLLLHQSLAHSFSLVLYFLHILLIFFLKIICRQSAKRHFIPTKYGKCVYSVRNIVCIVNVLKFEWWTNKMWQHKPSYVMALKCSLSLLKYYIFGHIFRWQWYNKHPISTKTTSNEKKIT